MSRIKDFTIICEDVNREGYFSEGDTITGLVSFNLSKETKVKSVSVKVKGDGQVYWTEGSGEDERSYSASKRYFKVKQYLVEEKAEGSVLPQGTNQFQFRVRIPQADLPSSFKGRHGSIVYKVEAQICRKWRLDSTVQKEIPFLSRSIRNTHQVVCPQSDSVKEKIGVFSKGEVQLTASVNRSVCSPGDTLTAFAKMSNGSSKSMKPKFSLQQKTVYNAGGSKDIRDYSLCKKVGDTIKPNSEETVSCSIDIPPDAIYTLNNCELVSVEYYLKVYLDVRFAFDPAVVFPLIIAPAVATDHCEDLGPYKGDAGGAPSYSDYPSTSAYPIDLNPSPKSTGTCGYPAPPFIPMLVQHPATALQPEENPPSYISLFSDSQNPAGKSEPYQKS